MRLGQNVFKKGHQDVRLPLYNHNGSPFGQNAWPSIGDKRTGHAAYDAHAKVRAISTKSRVPPEPAYRVTGGDV